VRTALTPAFAIASKSRRTWSAAGKDERSADLNVP
jgi:hypothetical protein